VLLIRGSPHRRHEGPATREFAVIPRDKKRPPVQGSEPFRVDSLLLRFADLAGDVAFGGGFGLGLEDDQIARGDFLRPLAGRQVVFVGF
jgi:hypothetical protein